MMVMRTPCHACGKQGESRMCLTDIPYFKEVIIMSFVCDYCGFRTNEVGQRERCDVDQGRRQHSPARPATDSPH